MKTIAAAIALAFAFPAAAQTTSAQHQDHAQHQPAQRSQHGQHQPGHQSHGEGCCADRNNDGRMDCCEQPEGAQQRGCCEQHRDHAAGHQGH